MPEVPSKPTLWPRVRRYRPADFNRVFAGGEMWPVVSSHNSVQQTYEAMRRDGESHSIAEMLALQQPPRIETDATFLAGNCNGNQFEANPEIGDLYAREAAAHGLTSTKGLVYKSSLAAFPGDPQAWVGSRDDVRRVCEERGWGCEGAVNMKVRNDRAPMPDVDVADDIVQEKMLDNLEVDPGIGSMPYQEAFEMAKDQLKPAADPPQMSFQEAFAAAAKAA